ncbi:hypothetical protein QUV00_23270, partial [Xanthomonas citri pv. citri]
DNYAATRRSRESGNSGLPTFSHEKPWIPAFAGMTSMLAYRIAAIAPCRSGASRDRDNATTPLLAAAGKA